jgi:hypothetical protein
MEGHRRARSQAGVRSFNQVSLDSLSPGGDDAAVRKSAKNRISGCLYIGLRRRDAGSDTAATDIEALLGWSAQVQPSRIRRV